MKFLLGLRLMFGAFRSWLWWLSEEEDIGVGPSFCPHLQMRIECFCCPFNIHDENHLNPDYCKTQRSKQT